ncbi:trypsin-like peptidase domain-containing protein [Micromonospora sp. KC723]|uniref:trypsin-like peptidase domain-containing protein n=1 Tax=Micromonospora sp. KC723 TaxID=2530381 RepID=UPI0010532CD4|nr:trypsin-like peptidase domain-containing protein [Micromonospora sp. KC723]TDB71324.1 VWA domain-containing protein [Micromonospora sp. KC723]
MPDDVRLAVAAVRGADGRVYGTAFLIDSTRLLTCAHVVRAAIGAATGGAELPGGATVSVVFPLAAPGRPLDAVVLPRHWQPARADGSGDHAVLELRAPAPAGIRPVRLARPGQAGTRDRFCRVYGFPLFSLAQQQGRWFEGRLVGPVGAGLVQVVKLTDSGYPIEPGFSGAPVWDSRIRCVIGMVVRADKRAEPQAHYAAGFMVPIRRLPMPDRSGRPRVLPGWRQPFPGWREPAGPGRPPSTRWRGRRRVAAFLAALLAAGAVAVPQPPHRCAPPVELRVAAAPDDLHTYQEVAAAYERWRAAQTEGCRSTSVFVYPAAARDVAHGLTSGWSASAGASAPGPGGGRPGWYPADVGPRPDAWFPGADAPAEEVLHLGVVRAHATVARSPMVLAVPRGRVVPRRDGPDRQRALSWPELFAKASRAPGEEPLLTGSGRRLAGTGWQVVRPDPVVSPEARMIDVALYDGAPGVAWIRREVERRLEAAQDSHGHPLDGLAAVLCRQRQLALDPATPLLPAVVSTEQALVQFNLGERLGDACAERGRPPWDRSLVAFYPEQTPGVDHRIVLLGWPGAVQSAAARAAADDFLRWLTGDGRDTLLARGFRVPGLDRAGPVLSEINGVLPGWLLENPQWEYVTGPTELDAADRRHRQARRPARVLLALDTSGSMLADAGRGTRFDVAVDGVASSLGQLGGRDEVGVWAFSSAYRGAVARLRGVSRADRDGDQVLLDRLRGTVPAGDTPLYRTIDAAARELRRLGGDREDYLRAIVVLTDGRDTASGGLVPRLGGDPPVRLYVIAVGEASCDDRSRAGTLRQTARATGGQCVEAAAGTVDRSLATLFRQLWEKGAEQ